MALGSAALVAFVATTDLDRATAFYGAKLGLDVRSADEFAATFDAHGTEVRVTLVDEVTAAPYTVLGWSVDDVTATVTALRSAGVRAERFDGMEQDRLGIWTAPEGDRVAWFTDPDGNLLSVTGPAA